MNSEPESVARLTHFLLSNGFELTHRMFSPEVFGNVLEDYSRVELTVEITKERGLWFVDLGDTPQTLFNIAVWMGATGHIGLDAPVQSFEAQALFLETNLHELEQILQNDPTVTNTTLSRWRKQRAAALRSVEPTDP